MEEYIKIETLFERDTDGSKKLIEGQFRNWQGQDGRCSWPSIY